MQSLEINKDAGSTVHRSVISIPCVRHTTEAETLRVRGLSLFGLRFIFVLSYSKNCVLTTAAFAIHSVARTRPQRSA